MGKYKDWDLFDSLPDGFRFDRHCGSPICGYEFAVNASPLRGGRRVLVRVDRGKNEYRASERKVESPKEEPMSEMDPDAPRVLNALARKRFQERMLRDILIDLQICEIEGWCKTEYIRELRRLIGGLLRKEIRPVAVMENSQLAFRLDSPCGAST